MDEMDNENVGKLSQETKDILDDFCRMLDAMNSLFDYADEDEYTTLQMYYPSNLPSFSRLVMDLYDWAQKLIDNIPTREDYDDEDEEDEEDDEDDEDEDDFEL